MVLHYSSSLSNISSFGWVYFEYSLRADYNLLKHMSKFFAEGNISDEDNSAGSEENENANRHGPSYQYVLYGGVRISWTTTEATTRSAWCGRRRTRSGT
jgi:hypothetical protein